MIPKLETQASKNKNSVGGPTVRQGLGQEEGWLLRGDDTMQRPARYQLETIDEKAKLCQKENQFPEVKPQRLAEVEKEMMGQKGIPEARGTGTSFTRSGNQGYSWRRRVGVVLRPEQ